ncbi:MAG: response regulator [Bacteroidota bacterium]|nr:response regulator [Bacteroidota bacterium]
MDTQVTKLFIVDDNKLLVSSLKTYLQNRFGPALVISTFDDGESCLKEISNETQIIILDYYLEGKNGLDILKKIKETNPKTEVIMLSSNEDIAIAIDLFRAGAKDYIIKGNKYWEKLTHLLDVLIAKPIRVVVKGFSK